MPYPRLDSKATFNDTVRTSSASGELILRNAFLIFRLVVLALLTNFAFLSLIFASWNINATTSSSKNTASGTSIFILFESCLVFVFDAYAISDIFFPKLRLSKTILECALICVLSTFHIASAISASVQSFAFACRPTNDWNICASSSLLVPLTWLNGVISLGYFLTLFMTVISHRNVYPDIWIRPLYEIDWFGQPPQPFRKDDVVRDFLKKGKKITVVPYDGVEYTFSPVGATQRKDIEEGSPWARPPSIRRGVDSPFVMKPSQLGGAPQLFAPNPTLPLSLPNRTASNTNSTWTNGSRFIERFRESTLLARPETTSQFSSHYHARKDSNSFPRSVDDVDRPIPLPRMSRWISADGRQANETGGKWKNRRWI